MSSDIPLIVGLGSVSYSSPAKLAYTVTSSVSLASKRPSMTEATAVPHYPSFLSSDGKTLESVASFSGRRGSGPKDVQQPNAARIQRRGRP